MGVFSCTFFFGILAIILLLSSLLCVILYHSDLHRHSPLEINSTPSTDGSEAVLACIYPAQVFIGSPTDQECPPDLFPNFYCPAGYSCSAAPDGAAPACYSDTFSCTNSTYCYDYIRDMPKSEDGAGRELVLTDNEAWVIIDILVLILIAGALIVALPLAWFFRHRIEWNPTEDAMDQYSSSGPSVRLVDSYSHLLKKPEDIEVPWTGKDLGTATVIGLVGGCLVFLVLLSLSIVAATSSPSLPTIEHVTDYSCFNQTIFRSIRWRLSLHILFSISSAICLIIVTSLVAAIAVKRIYRIIWNAKLCTGLWGIMVAALVITTILMLLSES